MPEILPDAGRLNNPKLLDQVRAVSRLKHYSIRTEQAYSDWTRRFIVFHSLNNPTEFYPIFTSVSLFNLYKLA